MNNFLFGRICIQLVAVIASTGCLTYTDVTNDPRFRDGWMPGGVYVLQKDHMLIMTDLLVDPADHPVPTPARWKSNPTAWPSCNGPVYAGTHIRLTRIIWAHSIDENNEQFRGKILDGEFAGREVYLPKNLYKLLPRQDGLPELYEADPYILRLESPIRSSAPTTQEQTECRHRRC
jgi:hypothetical protein